jgi:tripartite-type tricarboxylate transporter receptor subunit TctC
MSRLTRRSVLKRSIVASAVLAPFVARAQAAPLRLVVPFPPGGSVDAVARLAQAGLQPRLGTTVVVENRPGASGSTGTALVAKSPPDGNTWLVVFDTHAVNPSLLPNYPLDNQQDLEPVTLIATAPYVVACHPMRPYRTTAELLAAARERPHKLSYGSVGSGSVGHLAMVLLGKLADVDLTHVPYRGGGPAMNDVVAGHIDLINGSAALLTPQIAAGRIRPIFQMGPKRLIGLPDVPTIGENGYPGAEAITWWGLYAPAKTPRSIIDQFRAAFIASLREERAARQLAESQQMTMVLSTPEELRRFELEQSRIWGAVVRENGIKDE